MAALGQTRGAMALVVTLFFYGGSCPGSRGAWGWQDLLMGLLFPIVILAGDAALERISFAFHPKWWLNVTIPNR